MPAAIEVSSIDKSFHDKLVLNGISFDVQPGEYFGLVGINGSGKSTMIKALLDLLSIDGGEIRLFGKSHRKVDARSNIAFLPDRFTPPAHLRGVDFIRYILELQGVVYDVDEVEEMLASLELDHRNMSMSVSKLSKGMTQKLGLASCLLSDKDLLVLDEPMSGLDPKARVLFKERLKARRDDRASLFFSSHVLADVDELADRMAILHEGEIRFVGTPQEFKQTQGSDDLEAAFMNCIR